MRPFESVYSGASRYAGSVSHTLLRSKSSSALVHEVHWVYMHKGRVPWVGLPLCIRNRAQTMSWLVMVLSPVLGVLTHCVPMVVQGL